MQERRVFGEQKAESLCRRRLGDDARQRQRHRSGRGGSDRGTGQQGDEATDLHAHGNVYGLEDFKAGRCKLHRIEVEELGDVSGKTLLHLQCHFGMDTLSFFGNFPQEDAITVL